MKYSYVTDEKLRNSLQRKRDELSRKDTNEVKDQQSKQSPESAKRITPKKVRTNKKFESLKAKKKVIKKSKLKPPSTKALSISTKQLSSMIRTGLPLLEALNILSDSNENKTLKIVFKEASLGISKGSTFVSILERYPEVFNEMYIALVSAGETAGLLPTTVILCHVFAFTVTISPFFTILTSFAICH